MFLKLHYALERLKIRIGLKPRYWKSKGFESGEGFCMDYLTGEMTFRAMIIRPGVLKD